MNRDLGSVNMNRLNGLLLLILLLQTVVSHGQPRYPMYPGYMPYPYAAPGQQPHRQQESGTFRTDAFGKLGQES